MLSEILNTLDVSPEQLDQLSSAEQDQLCDSLEALVGGEDPKEFISRVWYWEPPPRHLMPILDVVAQARIRPLRICLAMPPGHAKTTTLLRCIVWWLMRSRTDVCAYVSYNERQALKKSRVARLYAERAGLSIPASSSALNEWKLHEGGGLLAGGARSGLTGNRVPGLLIYDDPYKDAKDANSPAIRETVQENFKSVAFTRLQGGSIIVLHTRWHEDDLIGWLTRDLKWDLINVPAFSQAGVKDALGRKPGEAAWPQQYPYEVCTVPCGHDGHLAEIRATIGEHWWHAMYVGTPRTIGKSVFHEPARYSLKDFNWQGKRGVIAIDPAATASTSADWSVLMVCAMSGYGIETKMWIVDVIRVQQEIPQLVRTAKAVQKKYNLMIACEAIAGFKAVPQSLRDQDPTLRVLDITTGGKDKFTRSQALASAWNGELWDIDADGKEILVSTEQRVFVPNDAPWAEPLIKEFKKFTGLGDLEDDQVDAGAHAWNTLYRKIQIKRQRSVEELR